MSRHCTFCGAQLEDGAKICTNCGRMVGASQSQRKQPRQEYLDRNRVQSIPKRVYEHPKRAEAEERMRREQQARARRTQKSREQQFREAEQENYRRTPTEGNGTGKEKTVRRRRWIRRISRLVIVCAVIYFALGFFRVLTTAHSECKFDTEMTLTSTTYSQAFGTYFESGKWTYNIFKNRVTYTGTTESGDTYVMTFKRKSGKNVVNTMTINGEKVDADAINIKVMGMFMAEKKITG